MVDAGRVTAIWRYPVKSMTGERLSVAEIGRFGLDADRTWAVRDLEANATTSAKKLPGLLLCTARYAAAPPPEAGPSLSRSSREARRRAPRRGAVRRFRRD